MHVFVVVRVVMTMTMIVPMSMSVRVTVVVSMVVMMPKRHHANQVDRKSQAAHNEQLTKSLRLSAFPKSLKRFKTDFDTQKPVGCQCTSLRARNGGNVSHEQNAVGEPTQRLDLAEAVRELLARWPLAEDGGQQTDEKGNAIEEHMNAVAEESK